MPLPYFFYLFLDNPAATYYNIENTKKAGCMRCKKEKHPFSAAF